MLLWLCFLSLTSAGIRSVVIHSIHLQKQIHAVLWPGWVFPFLSQPVSDQKLIMMPACA